MARESCVGKDDQRILTGHRISSSPLPTNRSGPRTFANVICLKSGYLISNVRPTVPQQGITPLKV